MDMPPSEQLQSKLRSLLKDFGNAKQWNLNLIKEEDKSFLEQLTSGHITKSHFTKYTFSNREQFNQTIKHPVTTMWVYSIQGQTPTRWQAVLLKDGNLFIHKYEPKGNEHSDEAHLKYLKQHLDEIDPSVYTQSEGIIEQIEEVEQPEPMLAVSGEVGGGRKADHFWLEDPDGLPEALQTALSFASPDNKVELGEKDIDVLLRHRVLFKPENTGWIIIYNTPKDHRRLRHRCNKPNKFFLEQWAKTYPRQMFFSYSTWEEDIPSMEDYDDEVIHRIATYPPCVSKSFKVFISNANENLLLRWLNSLGNGMTHQWVRTWKASSFYHKSLAQTLLTSYLQTSLAKVDSHIGTIDTDSISDLYHWLQVEERQKLIEQMYIMADQRDWLLIRSSQSKEKTFVVQQRTNRHCFFHIPYAAFAEKLQESTNEIQQLFLSEQAPDPTAILLVDLHFEAFKEAMGTWESDSAFKAFIQALSGQIKQDPKYASLVMAGLNRLNDSQRLDKPFLVDILNTCLQNQQSIKQYKELLKQLVKTHDVLPSALQECNKENLKFLGLKETTKNREKDGGKKAKATDGGGSSQPTKPSSLLKRSKREMLDLDQAIKNGRSPIPQAHHLASFEKAMKILRDAITLKCNHLAQHIIIMHKSTLVSKPRDAEHLLLKVFMERNEALICFIVENLEIKITDVQIYGKHLLEISIRFLSEESFAFLLERSNPTQHQLDRMLVAASILGKRVIVDMLLHAGAKPNTPVEFKLTALIGAAQMGHTNVATLLLDRNADVNVQGYDGATALMFAAQKGDSETVNILLDKNANINHQAKQGQSVLMAPAQLGDKKMIELLLRKKADPNMQDCDDWTALMMAAQNGHTDVIKSLLIRKATINIQAEDGMTAIMMAAQEGFSGLVKMLLQHKADPNIQKKNGVTALLSAVGNGHDSTVKSLLEGHANPDLRICNGDNALILAAEKSYSGITKQLIESNADLNAVNHQRQTALIISSKESQEDTVKLLLGAKAAPNIQTDGGMTALMWACDSALKGSETITQQLLQQNADPNIRNQTGSTALVFATLAGNIDKVKQLLISKADPTIALNNGMTALLIATQNEHLDIAGLLCTPNANLNAQTEDGWSILILATQHGYSGLTQKLLLNKADPNGQTDDGTTALIMSAQQGCEEITSQLLAMNADPAIQRKDDRWTALMMAAKKGYEGIIKSLLENKANPNHGASDGWRALMSSAEIGSEDITHQLLEAKSNPNLTMNNGTTALIMAAQNGHTAITQQLLKSKADANVKTNDGVTALISASISGSEKTVDALLKNNADPNAQANNGLTPLMIVSAMKKPSIVFSLLKWGAISEKYPPLTTASKEQFFNEAIEEKDKSYIAYILNRADTLKTTLIENLKKMLELTACFFDLPQMADDPLRQVLQKQRATPSEDLTAVVDRIIERHTPTSQVSGGRKIGP